LPWLAAQRPVQVWEPVVPLRWSAGDPVERLVDEVLAMAPASGLARAAAREQVVGRAVSPVELGSAGGAVGASRVRYARLHPDEMAADDGLLGEVVGLLVEAHYRTTPSDLHRLLDAPNLELHAMLQRSRVVAVNLIAHEGGLPVAALADRVRGHALAENLSSQAGRPEAAALRMVRSVRLAVHPDFRRAGLARRLTEAVHAAHDPDLFGTVFGATEEVITLRRGLGYELVRLGNGRGVRSGEPSAVMVRACSQAAQELVEALRVDLARDLPLQLDLLDADGPPRLEPSLRAALLAGLPRVPARDPAAVALLLAEYLAGRRTYEAAATAIEASVALCGLDGLRGRERLLVELRVLQRLGWREVTKRAGLPSVAATMRAVRAAVGAAVG
jgi:tRNA(Met) cytidine acetyltransferase